MKKQFMFNTGIDRLSKMITYLEELGVDVSGMVMSESVSLMVDVEKVLTEHGIEFEKNEISS